MFILGAQVETLLGMELVSLMRNVAKRAEHLLGHVLEGKINKSWKRPNFFQSNPFQIWCLLCFHDLNLWNNCLPKLFLPQKPWLPISLHIDI